MIYTIIYIIIILGNINDKAEMLKKAMNKRKFAFKSMSDWQQTSQKPMEIRI